MKRKNVFRMVRYLCVAGIAIFGLVAIVGTGSDDVKKALCQDFSADGMFTYDNATGSLTVTGSGSGLPDYITELVGGTFMVEM
ncbi:MAG: hypothetical protein NT072_11890 [Deltaproteobacteria bacterium]|nr:hypothetical protein [Deltaproteobacteria bacterium]